MSDTVSGRRSTAVLTLNIEEVSGVSDVPGYGEAVIENDDDNNAVEVNGNVNGKRNNGHLQSNVRGTKRQRATRSKKGRSIELDLGRDSTVLDLKKQVRPNTP